MDKKTHMSSEELLLIKEAGFDTGVGLNLYSDDVDGRDGGVYFLTAVGAGMVKIGTVVDISNVQKRIDLLQAGCPYLLKHQFTLSPAGRMEESRLHKMFAEYLIRGEWYWCKGRLKAYLQHAAFDPVAARQRMLLQLIP